MSTKRSSIKEKLQALEEAKLIKANKVIVKNIPGPPGPRGLKGDKGDKGDEGLSAYELWLARGYEGTEEDFLEYLKGEAGAKPQLGVDYVVVAGPAGRDGVDTDPAILNGYLRLDQTIPQTVINGATEFADGLLVTGGSGLDLMNGQTIQVFNVGNTKWLSLRHDGTNSSIHSSSGGIHLENTVTLSATAKLIINSSADAEQIEISHNNTNGLITSTDGTISFDDENLITTGTIDCAEVFNSAGNLKLNSGAQGGVFLFSETDVGDDDIGKTFAICRRAAEGDVTLSMWGNKDRQFDIQSTNDIHVSSSQAGGEIHLGTVATNVVRLVGDMNSIGLRKYGTESENLPLRHYGYITAGGLSGQKYVEWLVDDSDDYFHLSRQNDYIKGFKIDMGLGVSGDIIASSIIGGSAVGSKITYKSTTGTGTTTGIAHQFVGGTDGGTVAMTLLNNGKVGIGTTGPAYKFQVSDGTNAFISADSASFRTKFGRGLSDLAAQTIDIGGHLQFTPVTQVSTAGMTIAPAGQGAGNLNNGVYSYQIVYTTADGETGADTYYTNQGTIVNRDTDGKMLLSSIPVNPDPRVINKKIYRTVVNGTYSLAYYMDTISNVTTTFLDNIADTTATDDFYRKVNTTAGFMYSGSNLIMATPDMYHTFLGVNAGKNNTTGNSVVFIGGGAGRVNTTGANSNYIGYNAGYHITTGSSNNVMGTAALYNTLGTSNLNVAIGHSSLRAGTSGIYHNQNVGIGASTLNGADSGDLTGNIAIGYEAMTDPSQSGSTLYNIAIGYKAGKTIASGDYNIMLGYQAEPSATGVSNELNIGNNFYATGINTANTAKFGIGVIAPSARLHLPAGTTAANTAPLKFTAGTLLSSLELGALEFTDNGTNGHLYITLNVAGVLTRVQIV